MRPIGGFFYCFSCQPYKETNPACRGSWEHKHFLFLFSFFFFSLPLFFVFAFLMFIAIVQRSAEGQKVFTLKLMISTCRFVWRTTKSVLQSLYGSLLFTAVSDNTHPRKPRGSQSVLVKKHEESFRAWKISSRLFSPPDWLPLDLPGLITRDLRRLWNLSFSATSIKLWRLGTF